MGKMKTRFFKFTDLAEAVTFFSGLDLYSEEDGFSTFAVNEDRSPFGLHHIGYINEVTSTENLNSEGRPVEEEPYVAVSVAKPVEGYLVNGIGALPEELQQYEVFPETPYALFS